MFTPEGEASPIKPLSLAEYDFDKAVGFFNDAKALREKELLQQFENGKVRDEYRQLLKEGKMTYEELQAVLEGKKSEVVREVVEGGKTRFMPDGSRFAFAEKGTAEATTGRMTANNSGESLPITSAVDNSISQSSEVVKKKFALSNSTTLEQDTEYLELAKNPEKNEARLREMVEEAAVVIGLNIEKPLFEDTVITNKIVYIPMYAVLIFSLFIQKSQIFIDFFILI